LSLRCDIPMLKRGYMLLRGALRLLVRSDTSRSVYNSDSQLLGPVFSGSRALAWAKKIKSCAFILKGIFYAAECRLFTLLSSRWPFNVNRHPPFHSIEENANMLIEHGETQVRH